MRKITYNIAAFFGLEGRGQLRPGYHADICIFDADTISPTMPVLTHDLPAGAPRIIQKSDGILATIVGGDVLIRMEGQEIADLQAYSDILRTLAPGQNITCAVLREGAEIELTATVEAR